MTLKDIQHLDFSQLLDFLEAKIPSEQRNAITRHLELCSSCSGRYREVEDLLSLMKTDEAVDPPRDVVSMAVNLFQNRTKQPSLVRRLVALLNFDSLTQAPAFGVRSSATTSRQLVYAVEDCEIDLRITEDNGQWQLTGQVLGFDDCSPGRVDIDGDSVIESAPLNDLCEFTLPPVPSGDYKLTLRFSELEVEVPRLELRA